MSNSRREELARAGLARREAMLNAADERAWEKYDAADKIAWDDQVTVNNAQAEIYLHGQTGIPFRMPDYPGKRFRIKGPFFSRTIPVFVEDEPEDLGGGYVFFNNMDVVDLAKQLRISSPRVRHR